MYGIGAPTRLVEEGTGNEPKDTKTGIGGKE